MREAGRISIAVALVAGSIVWGGSSVWAGEVTGEPDGTVQWRANNAEGPSFVRLPDGGWQLFTTSVQAVRTPNRDGVNMAMTIAEERGKAAIVRYMKEEVASGRFTQEVTADAAVSQTNSKQDGADEKQEQLTESTKLSVANTVREVQTSYSHGELSGVTVLSQVYDQKAREAIVKVGFSSKTTAAARQMRAAMHDATSDSVPAGQSTATHHSGSVQGPGSQNRTSTDDKW